MNTYLDDLAFELRMLDVPGSRIGEIIAEAEAHVSETGEDPAEAFGPVKDYARERAGATEAEQSGNFVVRLLRGNVLLAVGCFLVTGLGAWLMVGGILALTVVRATAPLGLPAWAAIAIGALLLGAWGVWFFRLLGRDRVVDPRTGREAQWDARGHRKAN